MLITFILVLIFVAVDQASKYLATRFLQPIGDIPLWEDVFHLYYTQNDGVSFGMFAGAGGRWVIVALCLVAVGGVVFYMLRNHRHMPRLVRISLALILGGAIGNLIDRVYLGYVVDFFYAKIINFAIFNVADACISVGGVMLALYLILSWRAEGRGVQADGQPVVCAREENIADGGPQELAADAANQPALKDEPGDEPHGG